MADLTKKKLYQNVELVRFIGILCIMGHHLYHIGLEGNSGYLFQNCWEWVEFFFILTGALTYKHFAEPKQYPDCGREAVSYTLRKFRRIFPFAFAAVLAQNLITYLQILLNGDLVNFARAFLEMPYEVLFLSSAGFTQERLAPIWYLSAMFIVLPLFVYLIMKHREFWKVLSILLPVLYYGYKGINTDRAWPNDMVRAIAAMSLGSVACQVSLWLAARPERKRDTVLLSFAETGCLLMALAISVTNRASLDLMELLFFILVVCMLSGRTLSSSFHGPIFPWLGRLSLPMFLFHWAVGTAAVRLTESLSARMWIYYLGTFAVSALAVALTDRRRKLSIL